MHLIDFELSQARKIKVNIRSFIFVVYFFEKCIKFFLIEFRLYIFNLLKKKDIEFIRINDN